jgi:hypothetical protein
VRCGAYRTKVGLGPTAVRRLQVSRSAAPSPWCPGRDLTLRANAPNRPAPTCGVVLSYAVAGRFGEDAFECASGPGFMIAQLLETFTITGFFSSTTSPPKMSA